MTFEIKLPGTLDRTTRHALAELIGDDALEQRTDTFVISARDQAALLGILRRLNELGIRIDNVERT